MDSSTNPGSALGSKAASGVGWNVAGVLVRSAAAFFINIVLARLLGPEPFGLVALTMAVVTLGNLLVDSGLSLQLIRQPALTPKTVRAVFTLQLLLGGLLTLAIVLAAPLVTGLLSQPAAAPVIRTLAFLLLLNSAGQPSAALLRRDLRFKTIQQIQILSYLLSYGALGLPLALAGAGVWALVWAQLAQAACGAILNWALVRHSLLPWVGPESRSMLRLGSYLAGSNVVCWSLAALPSVLIGRAMGAGALGFYSRAWNLVGLPSSTLVPAVQNVTMPLFSRPPADSATLGRALLSVLSVSALAVFPASLLIAGSALVLVPVVLGPAWMAAVPLCAPLACAMCCDSIASLCGTFLISRGRPDLELRTMLMAAGCGAISLAVGVGYGASLTVFAWMVCVCVYLLRAVVAAAFASRIARVSWTQLGAALRSGALLGAIVFAVAHGIAVSLTPAPPWMRLAACGSAAVCTAVLLVLLLPRLLLYSDLAWTIRRSGAPFLLAVAPWLERQQARTRRPVPYLVDEVP